MFDDDSNSSGGVSSSDPASSENLSSASEAGGAQSSSQPSAGTPDGGTYIGACQNLSTQEFSKSDQTAANAGSDRSMDSASASCPAGSSSPPASIPCDIDDLVLNQIPGSKTTMYQVKDWSFVPDPPQGSKRAVCLTGVSGVSKQPKLQVVGDRPGAKATTQIRVYVYPWASCGASHALVTAMGPDGTDVEKVFSSQNTFDFPVSRYQSTNAALALFERLITIGLPPNSYIVSATSCGNRGNGRPAYTGGNLNVEVYPADQYQLTLSIPPLSKKTYSLDKDFTAKTTTATTTSVDGDESTSTTDEMRNDTRRHHITYKQAKADEKPKIELKRNGQADDVSVSINKLFGILQEINKAMAAIQKLLHDWVPQVGFKFEYELAFLSGKVMIACGWKEWTDWRVYYAFSAGISITLIKISLNVSFGLKVGPALARVEGKIDDAKVELDEDYNFNTPDIPAEFDLTAKIDIPAILQGRAEADIYIVRVSYAAGVKTGLSGEGGFRMKGKWSCFADVKWVGIKAFLLESGPTGAEEEKAVQLVGEKEIYTGELEF
jgi:hypothetical protein